MKKLLWLLLLTSIFCKAQNVNINLTQPNGFNYTLPANETVTSAGVYTADGKVLLRTLWTNVKKAIGAHRDYWDGRDDQGNTLPFNVNYLVRVASNNDTFSWGVIGNTSTNLTGSTVWRGGTLPVSMVQVGGIFSCAQDFSERSTSQCKFNPASPQQKIEYKATGQTYQASMFVCANNTYKFWAGKDYQGVSNFIYAELSSNDNVVNLTAGVPFTGTPPMGNYTKVIGLNTLGNTGAFTGLTVQSTSSANGYLFAAQKAQNRILVFKTGDGSGSLVQTIVITAPTNLKLENDGTLWVAQGTTVSKYIVNSNGTITATSTQLTGLSRVAGLDILSGNMAVEDAGTQQVVKIYSTTTLALVRTIGSIGGYASTPVVSNYRFYLEDPASQYLTFVCYQSDGTLWVGDSGNARLLHFSSTGVYIETIMYMPLYLPLNDGTNISLAYNVNLCYGQNTALFLRFLEFTVNYSQPLSTGWTLTNNWGYNYPSGWDQGNPVEAVTLLSNSRRYMHIIQKGSAGNTYLAELTSAGMRINMGYIAPVFSSLGADGYLTNYTTSGTSVPVLTYNRYPLTGFDGSNNPTYGTVTHSPAINLGTTSPVPSFRNYIITTSNKLILFDHSNSSSRSLVPSYHLGAYDLTNSVLAWQTGKSTFAAYSGPFPTDGAFDTGNLVHYPGGSAATVGNYIVYNYHGEGWQNVETGIFSLYDDNGLFHGMAGVTGTQVSGIAPSLYFSNSQTTSATLQAGHIRCFFGDESIHCGIATWDIGNLSSENTQTATINLSSRIFVPTVTQTDLLAGNPDNQASIKGTAGWSQSPASDVSSGPNQFYTTTRVNTEDFSQSPDVAISYQGTCTLDYLKRQVTTKTNLSNWTISGEALLNFNTFKGSELTGSHNKVYLEITDRNGKAIARLYFYTTNRVAFNNIFYGPYNNVKYGSNQFVVQRVSSNVYLSINLWGTWLTTPAAGVPMYDVTADISNPVSISWNYVFPTADFASGSFTKLLFQGQ